MKKLLNFWLLLPLYALVTGCDDGDGPDDRIWDFYNPSVCFFVQDPETGENLLDPESKSSILHRDIAVTYEGVRYEVVKPDDDPYYAVATRYNLPRPLALRLEAPDPSGSDKDWHLSFGEFDPTDGSRDREFTIEWGDGSSNTVNLDLYIEWRRHDPIIHSPIRLDGVSVPEKSGYGHWIFRLEKRFIPGGGMIWDFINPAVCFFVHDAVTGEDLLDPDSERSILVRDIAVTYKGKRYEVVKATDEPYFTAETRYNLPRPFALRLEALDPLGNIEGWHLSFGDFDPTQNYRDEVFTIDWGDGTTQRVRLDLYIEWVKDQPEIHSPIRLDDELFPRSDKGGYGHWIFERTE